jgi:DNA-binding GntR family transcriptional regulator
VRVLTAQPTLVDQVYEEILADITNGQLPEHTRLVQDELARSFGVSRQPVQLALAVLRSQGFVREAPGRGLIVASIDVVFVRELYEVRGALEGLAARLAAQHAGKKEIGDGKALIEAGRAAIRSASVAEMIDADMKFHKYLYELSGNSLVQEMTEPHWAHLRRAMGVVLMQDKAPRDVWDQHAAILEAITNGDGELAERATRAHLKSSADIFVARLEARESDEKAE